MRLSTSKRLVGVEAAEHVNGGGSRHSIVLKRVRESASIDDGLRVLVDRLWPRGLTKEKVAADLWLKEVAPSSALRRWYGHDSRRWTTFIEKYRSELEQRPDLLRRLDDLGRDGRVTLVYDASDESHNNAIVLRDVLTERRFD